MVGVQMSSTYAYLEVRHLVMLRKRNDQSFSQRSNARFTLEHRPTILKTPTNCIARKQKTSSTDGMSTSTRGPFPEENYKQSQIPKMMVLTFSAMISKMMTSFGPSQNPATLKGLPCSTIKTKTTEKRNFRQ